MEDDSSHLIRLSRKCCFQSFLYLNLWLLPNFYCNYVHKGSELNFIFVLFKETGWLYKVKHRCLGVMINTKPHFKICICLLFEVLKTFLPWANEKSVKLGTYVFHIIYTWYIIENTRTFYFSDPPFQNSNSSVAFIKVHYLNFVSWQVNIALIMQIEICE